ncbi:MAG TPA: C-GCAxxG-C-C family protein [Ruminiclostridium sp.]|nr:C-GCAxxG-C-C family protein [Ruminiclostridium sp.]
MTNFSEKALELFNQGFNCSQAVFAAFCDEMDIDLKSALKIGASFGGGMGRLREVCGAVSGMFMAAGMMYGYDNPQDMSAKTEHYKLIQELANEFKNINGSIVCRELLGLGEGPDSPIPEERTERYYKKRPCAEYVKCAAEIMEQFMTRKKIEAVSE